MLEVEAAADCWPGNSRGRCGFHHCGGEDNIKAGKEQILDLILAVSVASATPKATRTGSGVVVIFGAEVFGPLYVSEINESYGTSGTSYAVSSKVRVAVVVGGLAVVELTTVVVAVESEILSHPEQNAVACGPNAESELNHASLHVAEDVLANESVEIVGVPRVMKSVADVVDVAGVVVESVAAVEVVIESIGVMVEKETCGCAATGDAKELTAKRRKKFLRNSMMRQAGVSCWQLL
ncbi:hypothetical protein IWZ03DRAFT_80038 [Phyllosticta citriasiana]|uniref:Uncharacterized protein n=1 Tax=Phyllosticta citriasiana TaxID=595635 RepID=A0ABR1KF89_9PEZI